MALKEIHKMRQSTSLGRLEENWVIKDGKNSEGKEIDIEGDAEHPIVCGQLMDIQSTSNFFSSDPINQQVKAPRCTFFLQRRFELVSGEGTLSSFTKDGKRVEEALQTIPNGKKASLGDKVLPPKATERGTIIAFIPHQQKNICYAVIKIGIHIEVVNINVLDLPR